MKDDKLNVRHQALLDYLKQHSFATVTQLSKVLYVSEITIRRDLKFLESMSLLHRSHGGALIANDVRSDSPFQFLARMQPEEKRRIAQKAASLVPACSTVFIDSSTTASAMVPLLAQLEDITLFTHSLHSALSAAEYGLKTYCSGGRVKSVTRSCVGASAERMLENVYVDYMFFSARGLSSKGLVTHHSDEKCHILQQMIRQSKHAYLLCDSSKADVCSTFRICHISELTGVITDKPFLFEVPNTVLI